MHTTQPSTVANVFPGRRLVVVGVILAFVGVAAYAIQLAMHHETVPWYMPCLATLGAVLVATSLWRQRSVWRWLALVVVLLMTAGEWAFLFGTRLPTYVGPVAVGQEFPPFSATRADGKTFTDSELRDDRDNVLVVFRGRW